MALVDLWYAEDKIKRAYTCSLCLKNPATSKERRCQSQGFENLRKPRKIDDYSLSYSFCPGKATWYPEISEVFLQCRIALETGIMPEGGAFLDQADIFVDAFPEFVQRWKERTYNRVWQDTRDFTKSVLEAVFGKKGGAR